MALDREWRAVKNAGKASRGCGIGLGKLLAVWG